MTAELIQRLVLPMVQERSREPGDAWEQAHAALNTMLATEASFKAREDALVEALSLAAHRLEIAAKYAGKEGRGGTSALLKEWADEARAQGGE